MKRLCGKWMPRAKAYCGEPEGHDGYCRSPEHTNARYDASPARRAARARYNTSPEGRAAKARYEASPKGRAANARYNTSPKGRARNARYAASAKGYLCYRRKDRRRQVARAAVILGIPDLTVEKAKEMFGI